MERPRKRVGDLRSQGSGLSDLARKEGTRAPVCPDTRRRGGEWRDAAGDQRRDGPAQDVAGATDAERRIRLIVDIGLLPVRHDRDRTLEHDDRSPVARMSLGEGHPGGTGWHDTAGETSGFAIVWREDRVARKRVSPGFGASKRVQAVGVDDRRDRPGVAESGDHEVIRPRRVREARADEQRSSPLAGDRRDLRCRARGDDTRLRFGKWEEGHVRILTGDGLDDRASRGDRHNSRAAAECRARREQRGTGVAKRSADDEDATSRLLPRIPGQWFERGADDASVERRRPRALGQRSPTATATARSRMCEIETESGLFSPIASRRASARP